MPFLNACVNKYSIKEKLPKYLEYDWKNHKFVLYICRLNIKKSTVLELTFDMQDIY